MNEFASQLETLIRIIEATLEDEADGSALASRACMSRFHFQRTFREQVGEAPGAMRRRLLLERAAWQLRERCVNVTAAAVDADYESLAGFSRAFSRAFGVPPSVWREQPGRSHRLRSRNGIHFDPAANTLQTPRRTATSRHSGKRGTTMDLVDRMVDHDIWLTRRLLERARSFNDAQLDAPVPSPNQPLPFESPENTLRKTLERLVFTKETWTAAINGRAVDENPDRSIDGMLGRFDAASREFREMALAVRDENRWDETFVDDLCVPAETFTYGGMIAHVLTFSSYRWLTALKMMAAMGVDDLGYGDPIEWERTAVAS